MATQTESIQKALGLLDMNNNEHWTADGLPRLDAVRAISGDATVSREDVNKAHPGFIRQLESAVAPAPWGNAPVAAPWGGDSAAEPATSQNDGSGDEPEASGDGLGDLPMVEDADDEPLPETPVPHFSGDAIAVEIKGRLHAATMVLDELTREKISITRELEMMQREVDEITNELVAYVGVETNQDALNGYFARQQQLLQERAARMQLIKTSGIDLKALTSGLKSPIDAAMSRKTGRGGARPKR